MLRSLPDPAMTKSSSIYSATTRVTSRSIPNSRSISVRSGRRCWPCGARTIHFSCPPAPRRSDNPDAEVHLLEAGHFALESQGPEIAVIIRDFLARKLPKHVQ